MFHNNPQQLNLHTWCLGADNSKNKASLWRWQRELLPLSGHQQGPSTSQRGPYLSTPTYRDRKDKKATASSSAPTLVDPAHVSVLGKVEKLKAVQSTPTTAKKTKRSESPKPSANKKKSSSSRPSAEDLKQLDDK